MTPTGRALLDVQRRHANTTIPGVVEQAMLEATGLSAARAYQVLNGLLEDAEAWEHDPLTVSLLRRRRASRLRGAPRSA